MEPGERIKFDECQKSRLEQVYELHNFINGEMARQLAQELGVAHKQIRTWFQNKRANDRRREFKASGKAYCLVPKATLPPPRPKNLPFDDVTNWLNRSSNEDFNDQTPESDEASIYYHSSVEDSISIEQYPKMSAAVSINVQGCSILKSSDGEYYPSCNSNNSSFSELGSFQKTLLAPPPMAPPSADLHHIDFLSTSPSLSNSVLSAQGGGNRQMSPLSQLSSSGSLEPQSSPSGAELSPGPSYLSVSPRGHRSPNRFAHNHPYRSPSSRSPSPRSLSGTPLLQSPNFPAFPGGSPRQARARTPVETMNRWETSLPVTVTPGCCSKRRTNDCNSTNQMSNIQGIIPIPSTKPVEFRAPFDKTRSDPLPVTGTPGYYAHFHKNDPKPFLRRNTSDQLTNFQDALPNTQSKLAEYRGQFEAAREGEHLPVSLTPVDCYREHQIHHPTTISKQNTSHQSEDLHPVTPNMLSEKRTRAEAIEPLSATRRETPLHMTKAPIDYTMAPIDCTTLQTKDPTIFPKQQTSAPMSYLQGVNLDKSPILVDLRFQRESHLPNNVLSANQLNNTMHFPDYMSSSHRQPSALYPQQNDYSTTNTNCDYTDDDDDYGDDEDDDPFPELVINLFDEDSTQHFKPTEQTGCTEPSLNTDVPENVTDTAITNSLMNVEVDNKGPTTRSDSMSSATSLVLELEAGISDRTQNVENILQFLKS